MDVMPINAPGEPEPESVHVLAEVARWILEVETSGMMALDRSETATAEAAFLADMLDG
ncbi:hypothetical protein J5J10_14405 [Ciceribacter sp. L1K23]|uniref:hypothetical protein n=1 Tax=unclassified Ciceribacter TaxID=2628820 RepID=UPI001ABEA024|nr:MULTISPECIES: hypothetical protein [unclassified Ciceribacter]MBO3758976.1 hypothetical protein [Ciceribacter sp. L1K22]MBR0556877.1 hypothetical protein [Ciceribacter sp. L1K23]